MATTQIPPRSLAVVTGSSTGIGLELAKCCAKDGFDLILAADEDEIEKAADQVRAAGGDAGNISVKTIVADLATEEGVDQVYAALQGRPVELLLANAGRGLGKGFLEQDWGEARRVVDTNVTGTIYLLQKIGRDMRDRRNGKILITGSIAGFMPGSYQAVYNGTKAFLDSFSYALREELSDSGVTVTCLMPGPTETEFFGRADMMDTKIGTEKKMDAAEVAKQGYDALLNGEGQVITGLKNKMQVAMAHVTPAEQLAKKHTKEAAPGTAEE